MSESPPLRMGRVTPCGHLPRGVLFLWGSRDSIWVAIPAASCPEVYGSQICKSDDAAAGSFKVACQGDVAWPCQLRASARRKLQCRSF
jgi:hypothetical protein